MKILKDTFVQEAAKALTTPWGVLGEFTYYRSYSRWLESDNRREKWHETVARTINYTYGLIYSISMADLENPS